MKALKIETAGIQRYIFSSNKLKVNLGASYIVEHLLFRCLLKDAIKDVVGDGKEMLVDDWFYKNKSLGNENFEIVYIGGGNALLKGSESNLVNLEKKVKSLVIQFFPGLEVYTGIVDWSEDYQQDMARLTAKVNENRGSAPFVNRTPNHGFFNKCMISGDVASHWWKDEGIWVSDEVWSKIACVEEANVRHESELLQDEPKKDESKEKYTFPLNFEDLSKKDDKAYIAIVHVDGNNFGQAFISARDINKTRELSHRVREIGTRALKATINDGIIEKIGELDFLKRDGKNIYLPIRPIITGGDDITFICEGTLGIPLAKLFLEKFHEIGGESGLLNGNVHACAGVAIVKQKYPFYRAYQLSEELIKEAKKMSRKSPGSYMSVMIAGYGTGTSLSELKAKYAKPDLYHEAYRVVGGDSNCPFIDSLESLISRFLEEEDGQRVIPRNKLMDVRHALITDQIEIVWPVIKSRLKDKLSFDPTKKPKEVFEAIELMDFYHPVFLTKKEMPHEMV